MVTANPPLYTTPSGLGGTFSVSIIDRLPEGIVLVRVRSRSQDWNGYTFQTHITKLTPEQSQ